MKDFRIMRAIAVVGFGAGAVVALSIAQAERRVGRVTLVEGATGGKIVAPYVVLERIELKAGEVFGVPGKAVTPGLLACAVDVEQEAERKRAADAGEGDGDGDGLRPDGRPDIGSAPVLDPRLSDAERVAGSGAGTKRGTRRGKAKPADDGEAPA